MTLFIRHLQDTLANWARQVNCYWPVVDGDPSLSWLGSMMGLWQENWRKNQMIGPLINIINEAPSPSVLLSPFKCWSDVSNLGVWITFHCDSDPQPSILIFQKSIGLNTLSYISRLGIPPALLSVKWHCVCVYVSNNTNCNIHTIVTTHTHYSSFLWISMSTKNFTNKSQSLNRKVVNFGPTGWCSIVFIWCRRIRIFMKYFCTAVMWNNFVMLQKYFYIDYKIVQILSGHCLACFGKN